MFHAIANQLKQDAAREKLRQNVKPVKVFSSANLRELIEEDVRPK
jgi:hypothetical protein